MNLQIQHVKKEFNHTMALADVTFAVSQGEFVSVIGQLPGQVKPLCSVF